STWNSFSDGFGDFGVQTDDIMARSEFDSQLGIATVTATTGTGSIAIGVTPDVQAWANGATNCGWLIHGWPFETDGTGLAPSEDPLVDNRPHLRVYWIPAGTANAAFRSGDNSYAGAHDTDLTQATPDVNNSTVATMWSDANDQGQADATESLLRFDDIIGTGAGQVPPNAHIEAAFLDLASMATDAMGDGGRFFAMLQPWDDTTVTWNTWGSSGIQNDGVQAAVTPTVTAGSATLNPNVPGGFHSFEVTADVQAWASNVRPNYGWAVIPWPGGSDGWGVSTSKDPTDLNRPQLRVYYTIGATALQAMMMPPAVSPAQVQVSFIGSAGHTYTVYRSASVAGPWSSIGQAQVGQNGTGTIMDTAPTTTGAFYRVSYP
ncbi:MAG TPA: DNRLRE domain-containing protein, partial [Verrucomicrobiae bacterium]|nr:DNRLRE domain-containing protein [Verrucomicrobiae bacterium]